MKCNTIQIGDVVYELDKDYRAGARAARADTPYHANPFSPHSYRYSQWSEGHTHEFDGLHRPGGLDVIEAPLTGATFVADADALKAAHNA